MEFNQLEKAIFRFEEMLNVYNDVVELYQVVSGEVWG